MSNMNFIWKLMTIYVYMLTDMLMLKLIKKLTLKYREIHGKLDSGVYE